MTNHTQPSPTATTHLFVYGTLKKGQCRARVMNGQNFLASAKTTPGYALLNCGSYPALVEGDKSIEGELWEVDAKKLRELDAIEGAPYLYKLLPVKLETHPDLECHSYFYQRPTEGLTDCGVSWDDRMARRY